MGSEPDIVTVEPSTLISPCLVSPPFRLNATSLVDGDARKSTNGAPHELPLKVPATPTSHALDGAPVCIAIVALPASSARPSPCVTRAPAPPLESPAGSLPAPC